jgi:hypothetical protein
VAVGAEVDLGAYDLNLTYQLANNPLEFSEYFNQKVAWRACEPLPDWTAYEEIPHALECAEVQAPLDWSDPATTPIRLSVIRIRSADTERRLGSVFLNYGGPGASGVEGLGGSYADFAVDERFQNLADYWGTAGSRWTGVLVLAEAETKRRDGNGCGECGLSDGAVGKFDCGDRSAGGGW